VDAGQASQPGSAAERDVELLVNHHPEATLATRPAAIIHVPHASTRVPDDVRGQFVLSQAELQAELDRVTDHFTDELFAVADHVATPVRFPVSRLVVDPERFENDELEPMSARGMGVIYTRTTLQTPLRGRTSDPEREDLLDRFYRPHHRELAATVDRTLSQHGRCLIIDAHSFPTRPLPYELDQDPNRPDICIGTDAFHTPQWLRDLARQAFMTLGYSVQVDRPFAGALVPSPHYRSDRRVSSVMIEINRGRYMTQTSHVARLGGFGTIRDDLQSVLEQLVRAHQVCRAQ
jgi:N-formylglutamate amidohydrolase